MVSWVTLYHMFVWLSIELFFERVLKISFRPRIFVADVFAFWIEAKEVGKKWVFDHMKIVVSD